MEPSSAPDAATTRPRGKLLLLIGLALTIAGPISYVPLMNVPFLRATALTVWILMGAGVIVAWIAARIRRKWGSRIAAGLCTVLLAGGLTMFFGLSRLPAATAFDRLVTAPAFSLPDQNGQPTSLDDLLATGPALLVFYRGHW